MDLIISSISQGLLWGVLALGAYITIRILNVSDLSVEGTFPLGAAVATRLITSGYDPFLSTFLAILAGMLGGLVTGLLHTKLKIPALLSGIITMTGLLSINLRILGSANVSLLNSETIVTQVRELTGLSHTMAVTVIGIVVTALVILILSWFFKTEFGLAIRSTGDNREMSQANGINTDTTTIVGFMLANGLVSLSGALLAQNNGYADVNMGKGAIVVGLASIIIGEVFFSNLNLWKRLVTVVVGSIIYRLLLLAVLEIEIGGFSINPQDLQLFSAIILALALSLPTIKAKFQGKNKKTTEGGQ